MHDYHPRGGGDGNGTQFAHFAIEKRLSGQGAEQIPADTRFTFEYTVADTTLPLEFGIGETGRAESERFPVGLTVTIREVALPEVSGITWDGYTLTGEGVKYNGDGTYTIGPSARGTIELVLTSEAAPTEETPTPTATVPQSPTPTATVPETPTSSPTSTQPVPHPSDSDNPHSDNPRPDRDDEGALPRTGTTLLPLAVGAVLLGLGATALGAARRRQQ